MADTWLARIKRHENQMEARLADELRTLATVAGTVYAQYARRRNDDGQLIIEDTRANRQGVRDAMWNQVVAPYFGISPAQQLNGQRPLTPFMTLIRDGVEGAIRIQAERHLSIIEKYAPPEVVRFLTGQRAPQFVTEQGHRRTVWYDPWHRFVDEGGYTLSDKGWRTSQQVRTAIDSLLDVHIPLGTSAVDMAEILVQYLYPDAARVRTRTPYGYDGSYWARRLARTEITAAAGRSTVNAAVLNPFVEQMEWRLSLSHPCCDICDTYAAASPYDLGDLPGYPAHPHELCTLAPKVVSNRAERVRQLQSMMLAGYDDEFQMGSMTYTRRDMQGAFNLDWLTGALLSGALIVILRRMVN